MSDSGPRADPPVGGFPTPQPVGATSDEFRRCFNEPLADVLNLGTWHRGEDLSQVYAELGDMIDAAVRQEKRREAQFRALVVEQLRTLPGTPPEAGHWPVSPDEVRDTHRGLLFNGGTDCCEGTVNVHRSFEQTIYQIGVCLLSYGGNRGAWSHQLYRRDLNETHGDMVTETIEMFKARARRGELNRSNRRDGLSELAKRAVVSYAKAAVLVERSKAAWKMGAGSPAPYQLLSGAGNPDVMIRSVRLLRQLILEHKRFVYVADTDDMPDFHSIGQALHPCEYAIVGTLDQSLGRFIGDLQFSNRVTVDDTWKEKAMSPEQWASMFLDEIAPSVLVGVYRASLLAPPQLFYAHREYAHTAARIAIADSVLSGDGGHPALIDLATHTCQSVYGGSSLHAIAKAAYARAGVGLRYGSENQNHPD